jgi:FXSXX-COOH protein
MTREPTDRASQGRDAATGGPAFRSDVLDLSSIDLVRLSAVPGTVLRASLERICLELAQEADVFAGFSNSLPGPWADDTEHAADLASRVPEPAESEP